MNVKELYDYKLKRYKETGIRDELDRLLLLLMLNEKDKYEPYGNLIFYAEFYYRYEKQIHRNIEKVEYDFDITKEFLMDLMKKKHVSIVAFKHDKAWSVYRDAFGNLDTELVSEAIGCERNPGITRTPEEMYLLSYYKDADIRLLNCLNKEFNYIDFIFLFVANLKLKGEKFLIFNDLKEDLLKYYYDDKYNCLFGNFKLENDKEKLNLDMMSEVAFRMYLIRERYYEIGQIALINIDEDKSIEIINSYQGKYQELMSDLTDDYLLDLYEKKNKQLVKKDITSFREVCNK